MQPAQRKCCTQNGADVTCCKRQQNLRMEIFKDLFQFLAERKKWWLAPIVVVLLCIGLLVVIGGGTAIAPFIYTLF